MDDLVGVEVGHAVGDLSRPIIEQRGGQLLAVTEHLVELAIRAVLHHDAVARGLGTDAPATNRSALCSCVLYKIALLSCVHIVVTQKRWNL